MCLCVLTVSAFTRTTYEMCAYIDVVLDVFIMHTCKMNHVSKLLWKIVTFKLISYKFHIWPCMRLSCLPKVVNKKAFTMLGIIFCRR